MDIEISVMCTKGLVNLREKLNVEINLKCRNYWLFQSATQNFYRFRNPDQPSSNLPLVYAYK